MAAEHNDIVRWNYTDIPGVLGGTEKQVKRFATKTKEELEVLLKDKSFNEAKGLQFAELHMPKDDAPHALKRGTMPRRSEGGYGLLVTRGGTACMNFPLACNVVI
ncbi:hypothetical protein B0T25DRAFT_273490 [Lasiosphaeria hispida]|uniref:Uncharacterized protein n=1 Tax=Lasiosphaeria hispida TaxID=260671 RepID=A0AAJ0MAW7_9PEZI|nr:hypothetical protein B0T25DRAFT_273490 [Lasiosphaeria hispida]